MADRQEKNNCRNIRMASLSNCRKSAGGGFPRRQRWNDAQTEVAVIKAWLDSPGFDQMANLANAFNTSDLGDPFAVLKMMRDWAYGLQLPMPSLEEACLLLAQKMNVRRRQLNFTKCEEIVEKAVIKYLLERFPKHIAMKKNNSSSYQQISHGQEIQLHPDSVCYHQNPNIIIALPSKNEKNSHFHLTRNACVLRESDLPAFLLEEIEMKRANELTPLRLNGISGQLHDLVSQYLMKRNLEFVSRQDICSIEVIGADSVKESIITKVKTFRQQLLDEVREIPVGVNLIKQRLLVRAGINVDKLMKHTDFKDLRVRVDRKITVKELEKIFKNIECPISEFHQIDTSHCLWGVISFSADNTAQQAFTKSQILLEKGIHIEAHKMHDSCLSCCKMIIKHSEVCVHLRAYKSKVISRSFWIPNRFTGMALSIKLPIGATAKLNKYAEIEVEGLTEEEIEKFFSVIPHPIKVKNNFENCTLDPQKIRGSILSTLDSVLERHDLHMQIAHHSPRDEYVKIRLIFPTMRTAEMGRVALKSCKKLLLCLEDSESKACFTITRELYEVVNKQIGGLTGVQIDVKYDRGNLFVKNSAAWSKLEEILTPVEIAMNFTEWKNFINGKDEKFKQYIMIKYGVLVQICQSSRKLSFFGRRASKAIAGIEDLRGLHPHKFFTFDLTDLRFSVKLKKLIHSDTDKFIKKYLDPKFDLIHNNTLFLKERIVHSYADTIQKLNLFACDLEELVPINFEDTDTSVICQTCYGNAEDSVWALQGCGCTICADCIQTMFREAIISQRFPFSCGACNCAVVLADVFDCCNQLKGGLHQLLSNISSSFIMSNVKQYKHCPKNNCPGIIDKLQSEKYFICPICIDGKFCRSCDLRYHLGDCKSAEDIARQQLIRWINEDSHNRKNCPNCRMIIEKVDGCNRIECLICHKHICWECLLFFDKMEDCYEHMTNANHFN